MTLTCPHCTKEVPLQINPELLKHLTGSDVVLVKEKLKTGESNKELAARLNTTEQVIKNRLRDIFIRLQVHSSLELSIVWFRNIQSQPKPRNGQAA